MTLSLEHYDVQTELGRGAMGRVFRATHKSTGAVRALKVMDLPPDGELVVRFRRESQALARVGGAHVVPVHESGVASGRLYYVMDLMPGGSLRDRLERERRLPWRDAAALVAKLARSLARCHETGIVHRDVKPENILFDDRGEPRLTDFGCARDASDPLTRTGTVLGTPGYMPPEQLRGLPVDGRADVYSLGVILHELVAGRRPYAGASWVELLESAERGARERLAGQGLAPASLDALLDRALAPRVDDRPRTATAFADGLERVLAQPEATGARRRGPLALAAVALVAVAGVALHLGTSPPPAPAPGPPPPPRPPAPRPAASGPPAWYSKLKPDRRPDLPLPKGLVFGERPGEYVNAKDGSILVWVGQASFELESRLNILARDVPVPVRGNVTPFFIGKYELSHAQFEAFVRATRHVTTAETKRRVPYVLTGVREHELWSQVENATWRSPDGTSTPRPDDPAVQVSLEDAVAYVKWAGLQLPNADQWYAAATYDPDRRACGRYAWGDEQDPTRANFRDASFRKLFDVPELRFTAHDDGYPRRAPVGAFTRDLSPWGAVGMTANVHEWVDERSPLAESRECYFACGGGYPNPVDWVTLERRMALMPYWSSEAVGFRVARR